MSWFGMGAQSDQQQQQQQQASNGYGNDQQLAVPPSSSRASSPGPDEVREHVKKAQTMTKLMINSHQESINTQLQQQKDDHGRSHGELQRRIEQIEGRGPQLSTTFGDTVSNLRRDLDAQVDLSQALQRRVEQLEAGGGGRRERDIITGTSNQGAAPAVNDRSVDELRRSLDELRVKTERMMPDFQDQLKNLREALTKNGASNVRFDQDVRAYDAVGGKELETLHAKIDEMRKELREEMKREMESLRLLSEHSAVRAGFLAVAASECAAEEKAWLFSKLKAREEALSSNPAWKNVEALTLPQDASKEWKVILDKPVGTSLGLTINGMDGKTLLVEGIQGHGIVEAWNKKNGANAVRTGDFIIDVNGKNERDGSTQMSDEAATATKLVLTFRRLRADEVLLNVDQPRGAAARAAFK